jgi:hypothetical protein
MGKGQLLLSGKVTTPHVRTDSTIQVYKNFLESLIPDAKCGIISTAYIM